MGVSIGFDIFARDRASGTFTKVGNSAEDAGGKIGKIGTWAKAGLVAVGGLAVAGGVAGLKTAAGMENAEIAFTTMLGSARKADAFIRSLADFAAKTPFDFPGLQTAASSLVSAGIDADKVIPIMTTLGDVTSGMGTGAEGIQRATVALQQMNAAGKITGEDLNQLRDAGIPVYDLLSAALGKSKAEVVDLAQKGKLGGDALASMMKALETGQGLERFNGLMQKQSQSLGGVWSTLMDTVNMGLAQAITPALPAIKSLVLLVAGGLGPAFGLLNKGVAGAVGMFSKLNLGGGGGLGAQFSQTAAAVVGFGRSLLPTLQDLGSRLQSTLGPGLRSIGQVMSSQFLPAFRNILPVVAPVARFLLNMFGSAVIGAIQGGIRAIKGLLTTVSGIFNLIASVVKGDWSGVWSSLGQIVRGVGGAVLGIIQVWWNAGIIGIFKRGVVFLTRGLWVGMWNGLKSLGKSALSGLGGVVRAGVSGIGRAFMAGVKGYIGIWRNGFRVLRSAFGGAWAAIRTMASQAMSGLRGAISAGVGKVVGVVKGLKGKITGALASAKSWLAGAGADIVAGLKAGVSSNLRSIGNFFLSQLPGWIVKPFKKAMGIASPSKVMARLGSWVTEGFANGLLGRGWQKLKGALGKVQGKIRDFKSQLTNLLQSRNDFAAGFNWSTSLFGADYGESGGPSSISDIFAQQQNELNKASRVRADVAKLLKMGLSKSLIEQLQSQGASGIATLHTLAGGTKADIDRVNRTDAAINAAYNTAGMSAANRIYGKDIAAVKDKISDAQRIERMMSRLLKEAGKNQIIIKLEGKDIVYSINKYEKKKGKKK